MLLFSLKQVPWTDLRYLFGEIMYGGHITDDWDRRLCKTYLEEYMKPDMVRMLQMSLKFFKSFQFKARVNCGTLICQISKWREMDVGQSVSIVISGLAQW